MIENVFFGTFYQNCFACISVDAPMSELLAVMRCFCIISVFEIFAMTKDALVPLNSISVWFV
jgi:hypothetical protein